MQHHVTCMNRHTFAARMCSSCGHQSQPCGCPQSSVWLPCSNVLVVWPSVAAVRMCWSCGHQSQPCGCPQSSVWLPWLSRGHCPARAVIPPKKCNFVLCLPLVGNITCLAGAISHQQTRALLHRHAMPSHARGLSNCFLPAGMPVLPKATHTRSHRRWRQAHRRGSSDPSGPHVRSYSSEVARACSRAHAAGAANTHGHGRVGQTGPESRVERRWWMGERS
jgi:hypothetical protein